MSPAQFVNDIVNILGEGICSEKNFSLGGTKNTLKQCIKRNKGIGSKVITMLTNMILKHPEKRDEVNIYLKQFLSKDELQYMDDIKTTLSLVAKKISNKSKISTAKDSFRVVNLDNLLDMGWTIEQIVEAGMKLDFETIENITIEHNGDFDQWLKVAQGNSDTIGYMLDENNEMIGYWHFTALFDKFFTKAKNGELLDSEITIDTIPILIPGTYNIYFIGVITASLHSGAK